VLTSRSAVASRLKLLRSSAGQISRAVMPGFRSRLMSRVTRSYFYKHAYPAKPDKSKFKQGMIRRSAVRGPGTKNAELMKK
jgi:hypothetical protein